MKDYPSISVALRDPLSCGIAIAERFMRIHPAPATYMYGLGLAGLLDLCEASGERRFLDLYLAYHGSKPRFDWRLYQLTQDEKWLHGAKEIGERFLADPRRDREGSLLDPSGRYTIDVFQWQFVFPIIMGHVLKDHRYFDEAARAFEINRGYMEDPETGVWFSRWGHGMHPNRPNPGLWSRGNGWLVGSWGRAMHLWDPAHRAFAAMLQAWQKYAHSIAAFQAPSGLFRQLLNRGDSFEEATGSGLFCSGFAVVVRHGTLPDEFGPVAYRAFRGLERLVDEAGNIHNASTTAGGYNFEQQYYTCARFNDPHGDGTVMSACAMISMLLREKPSIDTTPPTELPRIVTRAIPGLISNEPPEKRKAADIAPPVLKRALALEVLPEHDRHGSTILGLLHWHDFADDGSLLQKAQALFDRSGDDLPTLARSRTACELARRTKRPPVIDGAIEAIDEMGPKAPRDRCGVMTDSAGGYSIDLLYDLLPLLGNAGATTGKGQFFDEACTQLFGHRNWLEDPLTLLWHSAFGHGLHPRRVTPGLWALGNGYCLAGIVDLLDHLPREHERYIDVICLVRGMVAALHRYLPVVGGWPQILTDSDSFRCTAANGLLTYGCTKAILRGWVRPEMVAAAAGGIAHLGEMVSREGTFGLSSLPVGGLDTIAVYADHYVKDDPGTLGFILSGCGYGALLQESGIQKAARDQRLGAR